ncbi:hypothetical protein MTO96_000257 [Rhipicephalus appendiculatus]
MASLLSYRAEVWRQRGRKCVEEPWQRHQRVGRVHREEELEEVKSEKLRHGRGALRRRQGRCSEKEPAPRKDRRRPTVSVNVEEEKKDTPRKTG